MFISVPVAVIFGSVILLLILSVCQLLTKRAALQISEVLYIMCRNVREKAVKVQEEEKDVEILEAHLFDIAASTRTLLHVLGKREIPFDFEPGFAFPARRKEANSDELMRLADNILFTAVENADDLEWGQVLEKARDRFLEKAPMLDQDSAQKIISTLATKYQSVG